MGVSCTSYAIIGLKLDDPQLYTSKEVKAFAHDFPKEIRFHPTTGKALWEQEETPIAGFDPDDEKLFGFDLIIDQEDYLVSGLTLQIRDYSYSDKMAELTPDSLAKIKENIQKVLEPLGLWDERRFGLWVIQRWS